MATITRELRLDRPAEEIWKQVRDVSRINELVPFIETVEVDGRWRSCDLADGAALRELIVSVDDDERRLVYSIRQSPFDFEHHSASWHVEADGPASRFVWRTDFTPDGAAGALEPVIDAVAASLSETLG